MPIQRGQLEILPELNEIGGPAGRQRVEPQAIAVLELLADEPGRVWSRDELLDVAWADRVVSDATLTGVVSRLRSTMTAAGVEDVRIETRSKRGYVLVVTPHPQARQSWSRVTALTMLLFILAAASVYLVQTPAPLQSLVGVRLDFVITSPNGVQVKPVIWLKEGKQGSIQVDGAQPLDLHIFPELDAAGLIRLKFEANSLSHWAGFDHVVGLDKENVFSIGGDGKEIFQVKFVASLHAGPQLP